MMMWASYRADIDAAERRVVQSTQNTRDGFRRMRVAFRTAIARPSTLLMVLGAAGLAGLAFARRTRPAPSSGAASTGVRVAIATAIAVAAKSFILNSAKRYASTAFQHAWTAWGKPRAPMDRERTEVQS